MPLLGKDVLADDLPCVTGSIGLLGTRPSYEMMMGCDTLLTVGSSSAGASCQAAAPGPSG
jgi:pyruvate dehydrogenase (quinone)